jgi:hypothetical protein
MLQTPQGKQLAYELTMEYIKQNNLLQCNQSNIPDRIREIAKISSIMCDAIESEYHSIKFL